MLASSPLAQRPALQPSPLFLSLLLGVLPPPGLFGDSGRATRFGEPLGGFLAPILE
jgi:hypothetical protein